VQGFLYFPQQPDRFWSPQKFQFVGYRGPFPTLNSRNWAKRRSDVWLVMVSECHTYTGTLRNATIFTECPKLGKEE